MKVLVECVPNFSEGRDLGIIKQITDIIESVNGIKLLNVDPGAATNRTVVTFVGSPGEVIEAAFLAINKASELIDMSNHKGEHPRFGATDVCPLIPVSGISMEETAELARKLAERVGKEIGIPVYCYEFAAFKEERRNLANCREGEYEGLKAKLTNPEWRPDFGPAEFVPKTGAIAIGARNFLVAFNVNLNTSSVRRANSIAFDIREKGRIKRDGDPVSGKIIKDEMGNAKTIPGSLKKVKAIGWFIEEYGIAQISMNLTDISVTPVHIAFEEVSEKARLRGIRVTGSELVGLIPLKAMLDAGKYFLRKQKRSAGVSEKELIKIAVKSMGMDELKPFNPDEKIIEYILYSDVKSKAKKILTDMSIMDFADVTASESPAPGGGSVAAYVGALGISLAAMVANISSHKRGWDDRWQEFSIWAEKAQDLKDLLIKLVDEDTNAFNSILEAFALPKTNEKEKNDRENAIRVATMNAIDIPFRVMQIASSSLEIIKAMAEKGNPNSVSDAGVGAACALSAVKGAYLNVLINSSGLKDKEFAVKIIGESKHILEKAIKKEEEIMHIVVSRIEKD